MDNIIEPNESFDFSKLSLAHPVGIQGGAFFTKIEYNKKPLYIQTVKSLTRQGFVKSGKKYYCDLMFDKNAEILISWFENLEEKCHKLIYEKKDAWFQGSLEESDIETAFNSLIRTYKSGKYYLLRTNVKNNKDDTPAVKIYNEKEFTLGIQDITTETETISILEIQGIKFTSRNFQIEIELKQMMVLDNEPIFENCLIKTKPTKKTDSLIKDTLVNEINELLLPPIDTIEEIKESEKEPEPEKEPEKEPEEAKEISFEDNDNMTLEIEFEDLEEKPIEENIDELKEINDIKVDANESITQNKLDLVF